MKNSEELKGPFEQSYLSGKIIWNTIKLKLLYILLGSHMSKNRTCVALMRYIVICLDILLFFSFCWDYRSYCKIPLNQFIVLRHNFLVGVRCLLSLFSNFWLVMLPLNSLMSLGQYRPVNFGICYLFKDIWLGGIKWDANSHFFFCRVSRTGNRYEYM